MPEANEETSAAVEEPVPDPDPNLVDTLADGTKIKMVLPRQRACNEKNAKGKLCTGHLKRWYFYGDDVKEKCGDEVYRCEHCHTIYVPRPEQEPRSGTLLW